MKRIWLLLEIAVAVLAIFIIAVLLSHMWPHPEKPKDVWDILTAIGTVGAAVVAACIALRDAAWRREARESEALIAWGMLAPDVVKVSETLKAAKMLIATRRPIMLPGLPDPGLLALTEQLKFSFGLELLDKLAYLPDQKGARIAAALGLLPSIASEISIFASGRHGEDRRAARSRAVPMIEAAIAHFEHALKPI